MLKRAGAAVFCLLISGIAAVAQTTVTTSGGTTNAVPLFTGSSTLGNSGITQGTLGQLSVIGGNGATGTILGGTNASVANGPILMGKVPFMEIVEDGSGSPSVGLVALGANDTLRNPQYPAELDLGASNATTASAAGTGPVAKGIILGRITFYGDDGTNLRTRAATIDSEVYNTVSTGNVPAALNLSSNGSAPIVFYTNSGNTWNPLLGSSAERMRIDYNGNVGIGIASPDQALTVSGVVHEIPAAGWSGSNAAYNYLGDSNNGISSQFGGPTQLFGYNGVQLVQQGNIGLALVSGNIGIGTTSPGSKLEVNGNLKLTTGSGASMTFADGTVQNTAWTGVLCGGDYAEAVDVSGDLKHYGPGDVLAIASSSNGDVEKASAPYSTMVAGIYATKPGMIGRRQATAKSSDEIPMAMVGIVPAKVSTENGPIHKGDLLVTASTPGYAMKGTDRSRMLGAVIGKAMGSLDSGKGVIEVLVTLQ